LTPRRALTDEQIAAMRDPRLAGTVRLPTSEDAAKAGGFSGESAGGHHRVRDGVELRYTVAPVD